MTEGSTNPPSCPTAHTGTWKRQQDFKERRQGHLINLSLPSFLTYPGQSQVVTTPIPLFGQTQTISEKTVWKTLSPQPPLPQLLGAQRHKTPFLMFHTPRAPPARACRVIPTKCFPKQLQLSLISLRGQRALTIQSDERLFLCKPRALPLEASLRIRQEWLH